MQTILFRIIITWILFIPIPILNGLLREKWYKEIVGETSAHQIGAIVLSVFFLLYAFLSLKGGMARLTMAQLWGVGLIWLVLTLAFEFGLGLAAGRLWDLCCRIIKYGGEEFGL